jgi:hypothetical protein
MHQTRPGYDDQAGLYLNVVPMAEVGVGNFTYVDCGDMSRKRKISSESVQLSTSVAKRTSSQLFRQEQEFGMTHAIHRQI